MTYPVYSELQLNSFSRSELWPICEQLGCPKYASNQECRKAILEKQPKVIARVAAKEQVVTIQEIDFYTHEILVDGKVQATINHDSENLTQPWVVSINGVECFRDTTYNRCYRWFMIHHNAGTLPNPEVLEIEEVEIVPTTQVGDYSLILVSVEPNIKTFRCYKNDSLLGVIFQHQHYWSNSIDNIQHFEAIDAAVCLDKFMSKKLIRTPMIAAVAAAVLCLLPMLSPAIALEDPLGRGGCRDKRSNCEYIPPNNGGPDSNHGTGTR